MVDGISAAGPVPADLLEARQQLHPDRVFAVFGDDTTWTYADLAHSAWRVGRGLQTLGVEPGDCVIAWLPAGQEVLLSWFGTNAAGAVWAPVNPAYRGAILEHVINLPKAKVLITHADLVERLVGLDLPHLETVIVVGERGTEQLPVSTLAWDTLLRHPPERPVLAAPRHPSDDMMILYTSGTTGLSKGVRCSSIHHWVFAEALLPPQINEDDRYYECLPFFHAAGTATVYGMLARGGSIAVNAGFRTSTYWQEAARLGVTTAMIITSMANELANAPESPADTEHPLRLVLMSPLISDVAGFAKRFGVEIYTTYGMSELPCPLRSPMNPVDAKSCGRVWSDEYEVRIVDDYDDEVPVGTAGQLIVRHARPWVLNSGYVAMPEATNEAWRNGWFHTGDQFRRDDEGNYYFLDRRKDVIRRRGENISSFEVEREVTAHADVEACAAYGVTDGYKEDEVMIAVVAAPGHTIDPLDLIEFLEQRLPKFMVPRYVDVLDALPMSSSMKVQKGDLRDAGITPTAWDRRSAQAVPAGGR